MCYLKKSCNDHLPHPHCIWRAYNILAYRIYFITIKIITMNINNLPPEIAALARKRQQECASAPYCQKTNRLQNAFRWSVTEEGIEFWHSISEGNYAPFYARYGRPADEWVPKVGERVSISNNNEDWYEAIYVAEKDGSIIACMAGQIAAFEEHRLFVSGWYAYVRRWLPTPRRVTRAEIAKALNIEGDNFEIVD